MTIRLFPKLLTSFEEEFFYEFDELIELFDDEYYDTSDDSYRKVVAKGLNAICLRLVLINCMLNVFFGALFALLLLH